MKTARDIIEHLGGRVNVAGALGSTYTTVDAWCRRNSIPAWRNRDLIELGERIEKPISGDDLARIVQNSRNPA